MNRDSRQRERSARYVDRYDAGRALARHMSDLVGGPDVIVLGVPPGGVPVASALAQTLGVPFDIYLVHRVGLPQEPGVTIGAVASGGIRVLDRALIGAAAVSWVDIAVAMQAAAAALAREESRYRAGRRPLSLLHRRVVLVDDGLAESSTMRAAVQAVRALRPTEIIISVPVAAVAARDDVAAVADRCICPLVLPALQRVSDWYEHFDIVSDAEVRALLGVIAAATAGRIGAWHRYDSADTGRPCNEPTLSNSKRRSVETRADQYSETAASSQTLPPRTR